MSRINLLLTEREGRIYWASRSVQTELTEVHIKTTEGQYSPVRLELATIMDK